MVVGRPGAFEVAVVAASRRSSTADSVLAPRREKRELAVCSTCSSWLQGEISGSNLVEQKSSVHCKLEFAGFVESRR